MSLLYFPLVPVNELWDDDGEEGDDGVECCDCDQHLPDEAYYDGEGNYFCAACLSVWVKEAEAEARAYALENCRIIRPVPPYDTSQPEYRCTREEYESGARESHTPNAHLCHCRHACTNYDELTAPLARDGCWDRIMYDAIRERTDELVEAAIEESNDALLETEIEGTADRTDDSAADEPEPSQADRS